MVEPVQDGGQKSRACTFCGGSGECAKCHGKGRRTIHRRWPKRDETVECWACEGSGTCGLCHGSGRVGD